MGLFCFLVAGADSGAQRPSRFWLGSLLSARRLQPNVSGVLPTAHYVRKAKVEVAHHEEPAYKEGWQGENALLDLNVVGYGEPPSWGGGRWLCQCVATDAPLQAIRGMAIGGTALGDRGGRVL